MVNKQAEITVASEAKLRHHNIKQELANDQNTQPSLLTGLFKD